MQAAPDISAPELAETMEKMALEEIDRLPFGVIRLDPQNNIVVYNRMGRQLSGVGQRPVTGRNYYVDLAPCLDNEFSRGGLTRQSEAASSISPFPSLATSPTAIANSQYASWRQGMAACGFSGIPRH